MKLQQGLLAIAIGWLVMTGSALAQSFPSRIIRITVPQSSGSGPAIVTRLVADQLTRAWGQQVLVESKPGASGFLAIGEVKNAAPDGYSLLVVANSHMAINPALYGAKLPYDPDRDFVPVAMVFRTPFFITVSSSGPYQTVAALIAAARAEPGKISYGSSYVGSPSHLGGAQLEQLTGTRMIHVPFKDQAQMYVQIANGSVAWAFSTIASAMPLMRAGHIKLIALGAAERSGTLPEVPTLKEAGGPAELACDGWIGLLAPRGTPADVVRTINTAVNKALGEQLILERFKTFGFEAATVSPDQFADTIRLERRRYAELVRLTGATAN